MSRLRPLNRWTRSKPRLGFCMTSSAASEKSSKRSEAVEYAPAAWSSRYRSVALGPQPAGERAGEQGRGGEPLDP